MKTFLQNTVKSLKHYSKGLDKKSILVDKPWALIDSDFEIQKLIFKKNQELILSKDGLVNIGKWDYLAEARSLLIDRGNDKILCNEGFIDDYVMVLKRDGTRDDFFVLANENLLPNLDAYDYLRKLRYRNLKIKTINLIDGRILEVLLGEDQPFSSKIGNQVTIDADVIEDGDYKSAETNARYYIQNSVIETILYEVTYQTKNGFNIMVEQKDPFTYDRGERVWRDGVPAEDGEYRVIANRNIIVKDGRIFKLKLLGLFWSNI